MPALEGLDRALADGGLAVPRISQDGGGEAVVGHFLARLDLQHWPSYRDAKGELGRGFVLKGLPTTFVIGRDGRVLAGLVGPAVWDSPAALDFLRHYLDEAPDQTHTSG